MGVGDDSRKTIPKTARKRDCFSSGPIWPTTGTSTWDRRASIRECRRHHKAANGVFVAPSDADAGIIHRLPAISIPLSGPLEIKTGSGLWWTIQARLHTSITFMRPYALRMQPYAVRMHFSPASKKPIKSRAESACREPYALYAPLLGVGVFSAFFLLRELHTVHTAAYGSHRNQALALLPVGIEASSAREDRKCIRRCIRLFRHATPYCPPIGNGRRNRPDDPAPGRDGISTDSTHPPIPVGIVVVPYLRNAPVRRFSAPLAGFRPKRRRMGRASPPSAPTGPPTGYGAPPAPKRGDPLRPRRIVPGSRRRIRRW